MTNIKEKTTIGDVYSHIIKAFDIIDKFLPKRYVEKVLEKLPQNTTITSGIIRNVRNRTQPNLESRLEVVNALVEVALENQKYQEKLGSLVTEKNT